MTSDQRDVIVRFAPSPTGYLHIGGARTAIFNWLFARRHGGKFILRIEDTDAERSTDESIRGILDGLTWLGLTWDEGPNFQSHHAEDHRAAAQRLLETGHAYRCFCSQEHLDARREAARSRKETFRYDGTCRNLSPDVADRRAADGEPFTIRFKVPRTDGSVVFHDKVYGPVEKRHRDLEDFVIVRSNGLPLYILSNAVDDIRDRITHVIRGQDHLANTPKQVLIYHALGAPVPEFAHMSLTLDPKKAKISKRRHGESVSILYYRDHGFLPWAMVNFLVLLGWATQESREFFSPEELIAAFSLDGIGRTNAVFNIDPADPRFFTDPKLLHMNAHYLRSLPVEDLAPLVARVLSEAGIPTEDFSGDRKAWFAATVDLLRERFHLLTDFAGPGRAFFSDTDPVPAGAIDALRRDQAELVSSFPDLADRLAAVEDFAKPAIETVLMAFLADHAIKAGVLVNAMRLALTGQPKGPEFMAVLTTLGKERVIRRLRHAAEV